MAGVPATALSMFLDREAHAKLLWTAKNQELTTHIQKLVSEVDQLAERLKHERQEKVEAERTCLLEVWGADSLWHQLKQETKWRRGTDGRSQPGSIRSIR